MSGNHNEYKVDHSKDRHELQAEGKHPAPCAKFCEANAFVFEIRRRDREIESLRQQLQSTQMQLADTEALELGTSERCENLQQQLTECQKERDHYKKSLSKYGHHIDGCGHGWSCSCGFYAAMKEGE